MLQRAVNEGTGTALRTRYGLNGPYAGKTGTSQDYSDAWFVGYTPKLVIGTWVGAFDPQVHFTSANGTGGQLALPIVGRVLKAVETDATLKRRYVVDFGWMADQAVDMDCEGRRTRGALERFIEDVFKNTEPDSTRNAKPNIFERLFKKN